MHFNLFATGMLLSTTSAIEVEAGAYNQLQNLALAEVEYNDEGLMDSYYQRPKDNCCRLYKREDFGEIYDEEFCWDLKTGKALVQ